MRLIKLLLRRLLIFGLGIFCVWLIVFVVFETADRRLPWILAVGITYGIAAYIVLPRAIRVGLKLLQRKRVPSYTITGDGLPGDPVNNHQDDNGRFVPATGTAAPVGAFFYIKPEESPMSKETPKDDPRQKSDQGSHRQTDKPWKGNPEKEQRNDDAKIDLEKWHESNTH
jgi:hypothetical protein